MATTYKPNGSSRGVLFFGVGHGGSDPGAVKYLREEDLNLQQAMAAKDYAVAQGFTVVMSRTKDENDPLTEEIKEANASGAICAVDFHNNAGGGDGFEAIHSVLSDAKGGKALAKAIEKEVKAIGQNSRGIKTKKQKNGKDYFGFVRDTKMPAVICEGCFVDNRTDVKLFDTAAENKAYGVAVAKGIIAWAVDTGRAKKQTAAKPAATPAKSSTTSSCTLELPVLRKGDKGRSVKAMQRLIIAAGYSCGSAEADGSFGDGTYRGLCKFQKAKGMEPDGICGIKSWTAMLK